MKTRIFALLISLAAVGLIIGTACCGGGAITFTEQPEETSPSGMTSVGILGGATYSTGGPYKAMQNIGANLGKKSHSNINDRYEMR